MSAEDLESLEATIELLADPAAQTRIAKAEADIADGQVATLDEMARLMEEHRRSGE
jgi:PHD/YefM family antitoxin component YafN of YafNO toxin-antitoxin module